MIMKAIHNKDHSRDRKRGGCDWSVKDNDNESNSQHSTASMRICVCCDWSVKDNDNESNSQLALVKSVYQSVVIGLSKIMIMKAIHNILSALCLLLEDRRF